SRPRALLGTLRADPAPEAPSPGGDDDGRVSTPESRSRVHETRLRIPADFRSSVVAHLVAGMDEQHRLLERETRGLTAEDLGWPPGPGTSTIGMLLALIPIANLHIMHVGALGWAKSDVPGVIGLTIDDDGMPLPSDGRPPAALAGKDLAYFDDLLRRAQAHVQE